MKCDSIKHHSRREFLQKTTALAAMAQLPFLEGKTSNDLMGNRWSAARGSNIPEMIESNGHLRLSFDEEILVLPGGLQPSMLITKTGSIIIQAQIPKKPFPAKRMHYSSAIATVISRDSGKTWNEYSFGPDDNGVNIEGGAIQLKDGTIIALDTYITPGRSAGEGLGMFYTSDDDWQTLQGPKESIFSIPDSDFFVSKDDGGHPHNAERLHRRILELPNGDLLTTFYGWLRGDNTPATYMPSMKKTRSMLARSSDKGQTWKFISTIAVDPSIGTEGFGEPVLCRVSKGPKAGRLICMMRTGRELREAYSDNEGKTWSPHKARVFAGLDIYRTELWVDWLRNFKDSHGKPLDENNPDELRGAVVDPDLLELRSSGLLVAAFGIRIPQKLCWRHPEHSWNGNYLTFSEDNGKSWPNVVRMTSGVLTTHYMAIEETPEDNKIFVAYDLGGWSKDMNRDIWGRYLEVRRK